MGEAGNWFTDGERGEKKETLLIKTNLQYVIFFLQLQTGYKLVHDVEMTRIDLLRNTVVCTWKSAMERRCKTWRLRAEKRWHHLGTTHVSIPRIPWMPTSRRMTLGVPEPSDCNGLTMFTDSLGNAVHQREEQLQLWTYKSTKPLYLCCLLQYIHNSHVSIIQYQFIISVI